MEFMLDKITYNLLIDIQNAKTYYYVDNQSDKRYYDIKYLIDYQFVWTDNDKGQPCVFISTKGRVAIRNYEENIKLIKFNKWISIVTLIIATLTLAFTIYQIFKPC